MQTPDNVNTPNGNVSVRQNAALNRWAKASTATPEQIAEITGCGTELAQHMASLDLRIDAKTRHGKTCILMPLHARQTGGTLEVSAIQFLSQESTPMDFLGATETRIFRNQEAAVMVLPMLPLPKDVADTTARRPNNLILAMGGKDAVVLNHVTGIQTMALPSSRIPYHLAEKWAKGKIRQIWIHGALEPEMREIVTRLQDAGFSGAIRWSGHPVTHGLEQAQAQAIDDDEAEQNGGEDKGKEKSGNSDNLLRDDAWITYLAGGPDAVKSLLGESKVIHNPKKAAKAAKADRSESPLPSAKKALATHRKTGLARTDQDLYYQDAGSASAFLNQVLLEDGAHVSGLVATTGTGKTRAIVARMLLDDRPYIYGAPTNDLAQETYHAAIDMQEKLLAEGKIKRKRSMRFHEPRSEETCERFRVIAFLQRENRAPWAQGCQISDLAEGSKGDCPHAETCKQGGYLAGLEESKKTEIIFTVHQALTGDSSLLKYAGGAGDGQQWGEPGQLVDRVIVADEFIPMASRLEIRADDMMRNLSAADKRIDLQWIGKTAQRVLTDHTPEVRQQKAQDAYQWYEHEFRPVLQALAQKISEHMDPGKDQKPHDVKVSGVWADFLQVYPKRPEWLDQMDGSTLAERPYLAGSEDRWILPKLWFNALYDALKNDLGVFFHAGKLIVGKEAGLFKTLFKQGGFLLDATMPNGHREAISQFRKGKKGQEKTGEIIEVAVTQQYLDLVQILDGNKHGRASLGLKAIPRELSKFLYALQEQIAVQGHGNVAVLTHMPIRFLVTTMFAGKEEIPQILEALGEDKAHAMQSRIAGWMETHGFDTESKEWRTMLKMIEVPDDPQEARRKFDITLADLSMIGHWGNDERGHNRWGQASSLILWGAPIPTPQEQQIDYHIHRAIMKKYGIELEYWDGTVEKGQVIKVNGGEDEIVCSFPLPTVADARAFVLSQINAAIAQGIGRLRGVRRTEENPAEVVMYLGDFPVGAVEGGDFHLPTISYDTSFQSHLCQAGTKESLAVAVVANLQESGRICLQEICDIVNEKLPQAKLTLPKLGRDGARNLLNRLRNHALKLKVSLAEAARTMAQTVITWIMAPSGVQGLPDKSFYETPEVYAKQISDHPDWIAAVTLMAQLVEPHDPTASDAREGLGRWLTDAGEIAAF